MKVTIIGSSQFIDKMVNHAEKLRRGGHEVRLPIFDSTPGFNELELCKHNRELIEWADRVDIIWDRRSIGTIFDFGMAFAMRKKIKIVYFEPKTIEGVMRKYEKEMGGD